MRVAFISPARNQFRESRSTGGPLACNQQMWVRFPPLPPIVTVAEWLRRQTVDLSTRVQFPPVTPLVIQNDAGVVQRREHFGPNEETPVRLRPPVPSFLGVAQLDLERGFPEPEAAGSIPAAHSTFGNAATRQMDSPA